MVKVFMLLVLQPLIRSVTPILTKTMSFRMCPLMTRSQSNGFLSLNDWSGSVVFVIVFRVRHQHEQRARGTHFFNPYFSILLTSTRVSRSL